MNEPNITFISVDSKQNALSNQIVYENKIIKSFTENVSKPLIKKLFKYIKLAFLDQ